MSKSKMLVLGKDGVEEIEINSAQDLMKALEKQMKRDPIGDALAEIKEMTPEKAEKILSDIVKRNKKVCEKYHVLYEDVQFFVDSIFSKLENIADDSGLTPKLDFSYEEKKAIMADFVNRFGNVDIDPETEEGQKKHSELRGVFAGVASATMSNRLVGTADLSDEKRREMIASVTREKVSVALSCGKFVMDLFHHFSFIPHHMNTTDCEKECSTYENISECMMREVWLEYQNRLSAGGDA